MTKMLEQNPHLENLSLKLRRVREEGQLCLQSGDMGYASAPSNIALLKYWGKQTSLTQIPVNSSLSLTLDSFRASTQVEVLGRFAPPQAAFLQQTRPEFLLSINGESSRIPDKMRLFLQSVLAGFADDIALRVTSRNNFPTACGVASSAAGYAALVAAIADLLNLGKFFSDDELVLWLTEWSRLGSGSATRSAVPSSGVQQSHSGAKLGQFVAWELHSDRMATSTYAIPVADAAAKLRHCVLVLDDREKAVGSSEGHSLAATSLFQELRLAQFPSRFDRMKHALLSGDISLVGELTECDAYEMHTVMATGKQPLHYMSRETVTALARFVTLRNGRRAKMFWTLDAGANPHFIFESDSAGCLADYFEQLAHQPEFSKGWVLLGKNSGQGIRIGKKNLQQSMPVNVDAELSPLKLSLTEAADFLKSGDEKW